MSELLGRAAETAALEKALATVRDGWSGVLVLRGDPGTGKTALLEWAAGQASGLQVAQAAGIQAEMAIAFAGLHQLLVPFLSGLDGLPGPQRRALGSAFGLVDAPPPDRFLVGLAALTLLTDAASGRPVLCLVDDAQWLDHVSVQVLGFIARRLHADRVGMLFAVRDGEEHVAALAGLPELVVSGLPAEAAGELLARSSATPVDRQVSAQIVAEVAGNPLALVEAAGELAPAQLSGAVPLAWPLRSGGRLEELYLSRIRALPADTGTVLLVAAADPSGDPALVARACQRLGASLDAGETPAKQRLLSWHPQVRFRHPLIRSAAYYAAPPEARRSAHAALAAATDPDDDRDRRAWHLAEAAPAPDERVAAELERFAGQAQARGGLAAECLERAAVLTPDPARRASRTLMAAQANMLSGAFTKANELLAAAEAGPLSELQAAQAELLRGRIAFNASSGSDASSLLLKAADRLEPLDPELARETYLAAWNAASVAGHLAGADGLLEISRAVLALPARTDSLRPADVILEGAALLVADGPGAAAPVLRQALAAVVDSDVSEEELRWATIAATALWDDDNGHAIMARLIPLDRAAGALSYLSGDLVNLALLDARRGEFAAAASSAAESDAAAEATGTRIAPFARMLLTALQGDEAEFIPLMSSAIAMATAEGQGLAATTASWNSAILHNGLGRYDEAFAAAQEARKHSNVFSSMFGLPELIEAAARTGRAEVAAEALATLASSTQAAGTDFGLGLEARSRALVSQEAAAEALYGEAIDRLGRTRLRTEAARAHLLYGEWLRRQRRRRDARDQLRAAFDMFDSLGMEAFAARARTELRATGEHAQPHRAGAPQLLTPQEEQIARLVAEHLTNREIAGRLFISAATVEYHLRKIFRKLGVTSRTEVARKLHDGSATSG